MSISYGFAGMYWIVSTILVVKCQHHFKMCIHLNSGHCSRTQTHSHTHMYSRVFGNRLNSEEFRCIPNWSTCKVLRKSFVKMFSSTAAAWAPKAISIHFEMGNTNRAFSIICECEFMSIHSKFSIWYEHNYWKVIQKLVHLRLKLHLNTKFQRFLNMYDFCCCFGSSKT